MSTSNLRWFDNGVAATSLTGYRTAHQPPAGAGARTLIATLDLPRPTLRRLYAIHEAAHAVCGANSTGQQLVAVTLPQDFDDLAQVAPAGQCIFTQTGPRAFADFAVCCAAGEQAQQRWLREQDLHTEARGWAVELIAGHDREDVAAAAARLGCAGAITFGAPNTGEWDWSEIGVEADRLCERWWTEINDVAELLDLFGRLDGDDVATVMNTALQER